MLKVDGRSMKQVDVVCYLGNHIDRQGNNSELWKETVTKAKGTSSNFVPYAKG